MSPPPPSPGRPTPPALLPPKKRCVWLSLNSPDAAAAPLPHPVASQIHAPPAAADVSLALPALTLAPQVDAAASLSPAAGQKHSSPLPPFAGNQQKSYAPPPQDAGEKPLTPPAAKEEAKLVKKLRKVVVVKKVRKFVPKGTASAAAREETIAADAAEEATAAGLVRLQEVLDREAVAEEENEPRENVAEKPAAVGLSNAVAAPAVLGEETAGEAAVAVEPPEVEKKLVSSNGEARGEAAMSGWQKVKREVFVGGLDRDATEEDVREALAEAGEITEVRMIMDAKTMNIKNRGYCFVRYREPEQARKAVAQLGSVKICGKHCGVKAVERNDKLKIAQRDPDEDYTYIYYGEKRPFSTLGDNSSYCLSHNPRVWNGSNAYASSTSCYSASPYAFIGYPHIYHHGMYLPDSNYYGPEEPFWDGIPMRQSWFSQTMATAWKQTLAKMFTTVRRDYSVTWVGDDSFCES